MFVEQTDLFCPRKEVATKGLDHGAMSHARAANSVLGVLTDPQHRVLLQPNLSCPSANNKIAGSSVCVSVPAQPGNPPEGWERCRRIKRCGQTILFPLLFE